MSKERVRAQSKLPWCYLTQFLSNLVRLIFFLIPCSWSFWVNELKHGRYTEWWTHFCSYSNLHSTKLLGSGHSSRLLPYFLLQQRSVGCSLLTFFFGYRCAFLIFLSSNSACPYRVSSGIIFSVWHYVSNMKITFHILAELEVKETAPGMDVNT